MKIYIKKGEHSGKVVETINGGRARFKVKTSKGEEFEVLRSYCNEVPELGDTVKITAPVEFKVVERLKEDQPFVKIEALVRVDDVSKI